MLPQLRLKANFACLTNEERGRQRYLWADPRIQFSRDHLCPEGGDLTNEERGRQRYLWADPRIQFSRDHLCPEGGVLLPLVLVKLPRLASPQRTLPQSRKQTCWETALHRSPPSLG